MAQSYTLQKVQFQGGDGSIATATIVVRREVDKQEFSETSPGIHVPDAIFKAINRAVGLVSQVVNAKFSIQTKSDGSFPSWEIEVIVNFQEKGLYGGKVTCLLTDPTDLFVLIGKGYMLAINRMLADTGKPALYPVTPEERAWYVR